MTTSQPAELRGSQRPRVLTRPAYSTEESGVEAIELAASVGLILDEWQQLFVRVALAERADHRYAASEVAELVARQNGKGGGLEAIVLHGMFLVRDPLTLWTAHQFKTSSEAFLRMRNWIDGSDWLRKRVKSMNAAHGEEGIELLGGVRLRFLARSKSSGRGFSPQRVIWDEAQELSKVAFEAMRPAMRAQRNPQSVYAGTVPGPDINHPEHWTKLRDRGRDGTTGLKPGTELIVPRRLAWCEWSPTGSDAPDTARKIDLDSPRVWAQGNPALGYRLTLETLADDRESMAEDSFKREALSIWPTLPTGGGVLDLDAWGAMKNAAAAQPDGPACLFVDVSPDRASASIGVAARGADERVLILVRTGAGTAWVVPTLVKLLAERDIAEVALHPGSQSGALIPDLMDAGIEFETVTTTELAQACAAFITGTNPNPETGVSPKRYEHVGQPELDRAVANATTRFSGENELWDRRDRSVDITQLVAAATAAFRFTKTLDYDPLDSVL